MRRPSQESGVVRRINSAQAETGGYVHSFWIENKRFDFFSQDDLSPVSEGDLVSFGYEVCHPRTISEKRYLRVIPATFDLLAPSISAEYISGIVYILSNPSMPGLVKVGYTTRSTSERIKELNSSTGVPDAFRIEYELPIFGDPYAVEQHIHALLRKGRHRKEFFKVTIEEAKAACIKSYAELYPAAALQLGKAFEEHAKAEVERRKKLASRNRKEKIAREEEERQWKFLTSADGSRLLARTCHIILEDFDPTKRRGRASFMERVFRSSNQDHSKVNISAYYLKKNQQSKQGLIRWRVSGFAFFGEKEYEESFEAERLDAAYFLRDEFNKKFPTANRRFTVSIPNNLIEDPPPENHYVASPSEIVLRAEPWDPYGQGIVCQDKVSKEAMHDDPFTPKPAKERPLYAPDDVAPCPVHGRMVESRDQRHWVCKEGPECQYFFRKSDPDDLQ